MCLQRWKKGKHPHSDARGKTSEAKDKGKKKQAQATSVATLEVEEQFTAPQEFGPPEGAASGR